MTETELVFLETKNGKTRRLPMSPAIRAVLAVPAGNRQHGSVFTNTRTKKPYTGNGLAHVFRRAVVRAGITSGDVGLHTLRHTALSRMIAAGHSDHTVMSISGHSTTRMLERYTHSTDALKVSVLETFTVGPDAAPHSADGQQMGNAAVAS